MRRNSNPFSQGKLALIMAAALVLIWLIQPVISEGLGQAKNTPTESKIESNTQLPESQLNASPTVPALMPGVDPFKAHLEKNGASPVPMANPSRSPSPHSTGANSVRADPFKAFLEQQKQQNKDARVSPFGK